jgi:hypothetical protein
VYCFKKKRDAIKSNNCLACRVLMMTDKTNGAVVIVGCVVVVMGHSHKRGQQKNQYKESCKTFRPTHDTPFTLKID